MPLASNVFHGLFDFLFEPGSDFPEPSMLKAEKEIIEHRCLEALGSDADTWTLTQP